MCPIFIRLMSLIQFTPPWKRLCRRPDCRPPKPTCFRLTPNVYETICILSFAWGKCFGFFAKKLENSFDDRENIFLSYFGYFYKEIHITYIFIIEKSQNSYRLSSNSYRLLKKSIFIYCTSLTIDNVDVQTMY